jgi:uncharacterized protein
VTGHLLLPLVAAALLAGCGSARGANDNERLPELTGRVVDNADLLAPEAEARLTARLAALEESTTDQLVAVTVPDLEGQAIEHFARRLGNRWGIGRKELDNGVLLVVAPGERMVRIEVGIGLEGLLTDERAKAIIDTMILPPFREARFPEGIEAGVAGIAEVLERDKRRPQLLPKDKAA